MFEPDRPYSKTFAFAEFHDAVARAHEHAKSWLPAGTKYKIVSHDWREEWKRRELKNERNAWRAGWFYAPEFQDDTLEECTPPGALSDGDAALVRKIVGTGEMLYHGTFST